MVVIAPLCISCVFSPPAGLNISSFAQDRAGELYVIDSNGTPSILTIVPAPTP